MKKVFADTNIILDLLGERAPFYESAARLATLADQQKITMVVSPISFATVNYFLSKFESPRIAKEKLRKFKVIVAAATMGNDVVAKSLNSDFDDFEDALQYFCAVESQCEIIITRNGKDFKHALLPVMTADEFLKSLA